MIKLLLVFSIGVLVVGVMCEPQLLDPTDSIIIHNNRADLHITGADKQGNLPRGPIDIKNNDGNLVITGESKVGKTDIKYTETVTVDGGSAGSNISANILSIIGLSVTIYALCSNRNRL